MEEHIRKLCSLQQPLHVMGELISDWDFSNTLLMSLLKSWSTFIMANASLPMLTSDALIVWIMEEFKSGSGGMALKGSEKNKKSNNRHASATRGNCWNCGKKGHWVKDCWEPGETKKVKPPNGGNPRTMPNKPKTNQTIMISHSPA